MCHWGTEAMILNFFPQEIIVFLGIWPKNSSYSGKENVELAKLFSLHKKVQFFQHMYYICVILVFFARQSFKNIFYSLDSKNVITFNIFMNLIYVNCSVKTGILKKTIDIKSLKGWGKLRVVLEFWKIAKLLPLNRHFL